MTFVENTSELWRELSSLAEDEDLWLYDVERLGDQGLRIIIARDECGGSDEPKEPKERVTSGDCTRFCKRLMVYFTAEGTRLGVGSEPRIEVSSPGINRTLRTHEQFVGAIGERVKLVWQEISNNEKPATQTTIGVLQAVEDDALAIVDERSGDACQVSVDRVRKAHVDFQF